jgi:hypothetical protein
MTDRLLMMALLARGLDALRGTDERLKQLSETMWRSHPASYLAPLLAARDGSEGLLANKDVAEVVQLVLEERGRFPTGANPWDWAMLRNAQPDVANQVAEMIKKDEGDRIDREISLLLSPIGTGIFDVYWEKLIDGDDEAAKKVLNDAAALGFPVPEFLEQ